MLHITLVADPVLRIGHLYITNTVLTTWFMIALIVPFFFIVRKHILEKRETPLALGEKLLVKSFFNMINGVLEELSRADKIIAQRAERLRRFLTQPLFVTERYSDKKGVYVPLKKTLDGCERIINGEFDNVDPMKLYMIGGIDEIKK